MHKVVTTAQMREIDRLTSEKYGIPSLQLMENAARSVVEVIRDDIGEVADREILVICGPGNNGGDGAAIARLLFEQGASVTAVLVKKVSETKGDARINLERLQELSFEEPEVLSFHECPDAESWEDFKHQYSNTEPELVVDALFGTGLTRTLTGIFADAVELINSYSADESTIFSVDIPSGLNSDENTLTEKYVSADVTVSFTAPKPANVLPPASRSNGELVVTAIGSPRELINRSQSKIFLASAFAAEVFLFTTEYLPGSYKNSHGHVLVIAGSRDYLGAPVLCGDAAMRSGAGLVTVATPASALFGVAPRLMPEVITAALAETDGGAVAFDARHQVKKLAKRADVIAVGPGLTSTDGSTREFMRWLVENRRQPLVIDADGLNTLAPWPNDLNGTDEMPIVVTPHLGELRRLLGEETLGDKPWDAAAGFANKYGLIVVLKGERTMVISPLGEVAVNPTGNPGVGTAGAGDTMTGVIAGFLAQDLATNRERANVVNTVQAAVYVCGMAADLAADTLGMRAMTASDIREHLSEAMLDLNPGEFR